MEYKIVACGGTFDNLHVGHEEFLSFVFSQGEKVVIGLTSDRYIATYKKHASIAPYKEREKILRNFLETKGLLDRARVIPIDSPEGPAISDELHIEAIVVTEETIKGGEKINVVREQNGLPPLPIVSMPLVRTKHVPISSSYIRSSIMDTKGTFLFNDEWFSQVLVLPESLRKELHKPFGPLITEKDIMAIDPSRLVTVGDVTTKVCNQNNIKQKISVVDFFVERRAQFSNLQSLGFTDEEEVFIVENPSGHIVPDIWKICLEIVKSLNTEKRFVIQVKGEEDLLVLPLLIVLPSTFTLLYGQPGEGMVQVRATDGIKKRVKEFLDQFMAY